MKQKLTTKFIEVQKPKAAKRVDYRDTVVPGLVLRVNSTGTKTFSFHKRINRKMKRLTIGQFGPLSLTQARDRARQILYEVETGRFQDRTGIEVETKPTLGDVIPEHIEKHAKVHNKDWKRKEARLRHAAHVSSIARFKKHPKDQERKGAFSRGCCPSREHSSNRTRVIPDKPAARVLSIFIRTKGDQ